jgi:membrane protein required for colicin V production
MNWLDLVLGIILAASVVASYRKGISREIIGLASVVLGLLLGCWFYGSVAGYLQAYLSSRALANFAGFLIVFVGVVILGAIVSAIVGKFLKVTGLSFFDHLLGAVFGIVRGVLIAAAVVMAVLAFATGDKPPQAVVDSRLAPYAATTARVFVAMAPRELKDGFQKTYAEVLDAWKNSLDKRNHKAPGTDKGKDEKRI